MMDSGTSETSVAPAEMALQGLGVSPGIAHAKVFLPWKPHLEPEPEAIGEEDIESELAAFERALLRTQQQLQDLQAQIAGSSGGKEVSGIFEAHLLVLQDQTILSEVHQRLRQERVRISAIFFQVMKRYAGLLKNIDDPYLRERAVDIEDVVQRVLRNFSDRPEEHHQLSTGEGEYILVAHDLTPSDTATLSPEQVQGFATETGSYTSHTAIMARSLGIPAVVGVHGLVGRLKNGDDVLIDGYRGLVVLNAGPERVAGYRKLEEKQAALQTRLDEIRDEDAITADGQKIILSANLEYRHEAPLLANHGARGIGLYRTEFFYLSEDHSPDEEAQTKDYLRVARSAQPDGVIIRTFDIGGDKLDSQRGRDPEPNPFLGWRGIRVSLAEEDVFRPQLRAILRASAVGQVGIMFPLVSGLEELRRSKAILEECKEELRQGGEAFDEEIETGVMIEVPSAALIADVLAPEVDFFSFGTNDLIQYTIAVDRINEAVADLYDPFHPGVVRLMASVKEAAVKAGIWVGVCGEMASDPIATPLLVGLGMDELSVALNQVPRIKLAIRRLEAAQCRRLVAELLPLGERALIRERLQELARQAYPELFAL
ncbi:MAG: phosphoenolpyruvate--protein phosphotransferase [Verrucomicrobiota bacterium]